MRTGQHAGHRHAADAAERGAERLAAEAVQEQERGRRRQRDKHDRDHDRLRAEGVAVLLTTTVTRVERRAGLKVLTVETAGRPGEVAAEAATVPAQEALL